MKSQVYKGKFEFESFSGNENLKLEEQNGKAYSERFDNIVCAFINPQIFRIFF